MPQTLNEKLEACADRVTRIGELLAELTLDVNELTGVIATLSKAREQHDVRSLLSLHQGEIIRLLAANQGTGTGERAIAAAPHAFPFRLDPIKREVRIGRRKVSLTRREFQIVELLWEQMPSVVSREAILERLYGSQRGSAERVVDVHVYNIRQKFRISGATDASIRSRSGEGWHLELLIPDDESVSTNNAWQTGAT